MKYLIVTDTHLGCHNAADQWHTITLSLFQSIADTCVRQNINKIICLGDFFDERKSISTKTMDTAIKIAEILKGFETHLIVGNHDIFFRNQRDLTSLNMFWNTGHMNIINEPTEIDGMLLLPWGETLKGHNLKKYSMILGHFAVNGFQTNESFTYFEHGAMEVKDFRGADQVLSGHFHSPSKIDNIHYIGSPYQMDFRDTEAPRGYFILENDKMELVPFNGSPKYIKVTSEEKPLANRIKGNIVKCVFLKDHGKNQNNKIIEAIQVLKPLQLHTDYTKMSLGLTQEKAMEDDVKLKSNMDILHEYINLSHTPDHLKKGTVSSIITNLLASDD